MNRTSTLTATAIAALLAGAPVAAFAWSGSDCASNANAPTTSQSINGGPVGGGQMGTGATNAGVSDQAGADRQVSRNVVHNAQQQLQHQGYYQNGQIDGVMGSQTRQAVETFQQAKGIPATGQLDQRTLAALTSASNDQGNMNARPR